MKALKWFALSTAFGIAACSDSPQGGPLGPSDPTLHAGSSGEVRVTNSRDHGHGSFRAAVEKANEGGVDEIVFAWGLRPISLETPVVFSGSQSLEIKANGATLDGSALDASAPAAFLATGGGNLTIAGLTVRNSPQEGLTVDLPDDATGTVKVFLLNVAALDNRGHGILINDQVEPANTANPAGSDASLDVVVVASRFLRNGFGALDRDGLRLNEGGPGDLRAAVSLSRAEDNGADGMEFDERDVGDVRFLVSATQINRNGSFDVTLLDLDDGFDVDESNAGSLFGSVILSSANDNREEGFDFNENHEGDMRVEMTLVEASRNLEEGIDLEEDDDFQGGGDLVATMVGIKANGNGPGGDAALKIRERGDGNVDTRIRGSETNGNTHGGISIREDAAGTLVADVERATSNGNTGHGIDFDENSDGDLTAAMRNSTSINNGGAGVRADQQAPGAGTLTLEAVTVTPNTGGGVVANSGVVVTQTP
jgi:hypothetical protein